MLSVTADPPVKAGGTTIEPLVLLFEATVIVRLPPSASTSTGGLPDWVTTHSVAIHVPAIGLGVTASQPKCTRIA